MAEPQQVEIRLPRGFGESPSERADLAADVIDFIRERTSNGVGIRKAGRGFTNFEFPEYTEDYATAKGQDNVDLLLSGEMLDALRFFPSKSKKGLLVIGYKAGTKINAKAEGNQIGSYGRSPNRKKARPFLGITRTDLLDFIV